MGNEQGSVLNRAPLNPPCQIEWSEVKSDSCAAGREGHCTAVINNKIYCYGGIGESELDKYGLSVYDVDDARWSDISAQGPGALSNATLNAIGSKLYLFGGLNREAGWNNDLWCFDTDTERWSRLGASGTAPTPRDKHSCVTRGDCLIVFGGFGPDPGDMEDEEEEEEEAPSAKFTWFNDVYVYNSVSNSWSQPVLTAIEGPEPCAAHTATLWRNCMLVFGGKTNKSRTQHLYMLDLDKLEWSRFDDAGQRPLPCSFHSAVQYNDYMLVYGGRLGDNTHSSNLHVLDCSSGGWYNPVYSEANTLTDTSPEAKTARPAGPGARGQAAMSVLNDGRAVVIGGSDGFNLINQCCQRFPRSIYSIDCTELRDVVVPEAVPEVEAVPEQDMNTEGQATE